MPASPKPGTPDLPPRQRGRPKVEDVAAVEARILDAGRELFFRLGYGATSMSEVTRLAGASKTTLYARFPSKAELLRAIVARQIAEWDENGENHRGVAHCETLEETLRVYGESMLYASLSSDFEQINRLIQGESERFPELGHIARARFDYGVQSIVGVIRDFAARDGVDCQDPQAAAEHFVMLLIGWTHVRIASNRPTDRADCKAWVAGMVRRFAGGRAAW